MCLINFEFCVANNNQCNERECGEKKNFVKTPGRISHGNERMQKL